MLLLLIATRTSILDRLFGLHVISLIMASVVYLLANTFALIPTVVGALYIKDPWNGILSVADNLGYLALMFTTTNIAVDRFTSFFLPQVTVFSQSGNHNERLMASWIRTSATARRVIVAVCCTP
ncbi:hypothetical protein Y032_0055g2581 [Ancylostoma ceylanicum]|nr:hypothetical protein Y032_0055g2581 [Ancylostoma ceylanicum]